MRKVNGDYIIGKRSINNYCSELLFNNCYDFGEYCKKCGVSPSNFQIKENISVYDPYVASFKFVVYIDNNVYNRNMWELNNKLRKHIKNYYCNMLGTEYIPFYWAKDKDNSGKFIKKYNTMQFRIYKGDNSQIYGYVNTYDYSKVKEEML